MSSKYQGKVFYGWWIVAAGFLIMGAAYGIVTNCVGLFVKPVTENMGFTRQAFSMNQTLVLRHDGDSPVVRQNFRPL